MSEAVDFVAAPFPDSEAERVAALKHLRVLDSPAEPIFDDLVWLAARACNTSISLVSLIDSDRQWFKAQCGLEGSQTPRDLAFCAYTILGSTILEIPDTLLDPQFCTHPAVIDGPRIRFYAGAPLVGRGGHAYGTLCVADARPGKLDAGQREALTRLARQAVSQLEARQDRLDAQATRKELARILEAMPDGVVTCNAEGVLAQFNRAARQWHGLDPRALPPDQWARHFDLYDPKGEHLLETDAIPLLRAWRGEVVRDAQLVIKAEGQPPRTVLCNADPLGPPGGESLGAVCAMRDITELKAATEQVATERRRLQALVDASLDVAIIATDRSGTITLFNPGAEQLLGYRTDEIVGTHTPLVFHLPDEVSERARELEDQLGRPLQNFDDFMVGTQDGRSETRQWTFVCKDGSHRQVRLSVSAVLDACGTVAGYLGMAVDLTDRLLAQEDARLASERFSGAFAAAAQGMAVVSLEGRWLEVNESLCQILGYSREELLVTDFQQLTHPDDLAAGHELVRELINGNRTRGQLNKRYLHKRGRVVWALLSVSLVRDARGRPLHFVAQIQDVTEQHTAQERMRDSESRMRSILENSHDAFIAIDEAGRIIEWNRSAEAAFGWRRSEAIGQSMAALIVPPAMRNAHQSGMQRFIASGERRVLDQRIQLPAMHRSGREFPVELTISEVRHGDRRMFTAFLHDISARLEAEQRVRDSEARMRLVADNVPALIAYVDKDLRYRFANQGYHEWLGLEIDSVEGRHMREIVGQARFEQAQPYIERVFAGEQVEFERDYPLPGGGIRHAQVTYVPDRHDDGVAGFYALIQDVTAHKRLAEVLQSRALRDDLTGLPNRAAWKEELDRGLARANRAGVPAAVMFLDLDGFKQTNDTFGHEAGDAVLCEFARVLTSTLRKNDLVARLAGDEFVVLLDQVSDLDGHPPVIARKIIDAAKAGLMFKGQHLSIKPSIGIAVQHGPAFDAECLMRRADEAMYLAKRRASEQFEILDC
ncbi:PAS domain S-box protein [Lysobacter korlensis]|uniref:PAS domain S-box protein n=1 Tax=Lysobacter korlensis TaxID=553636 RepID=A0ABV6RUN2_9GAMM